MPASQNQVWSGDIRYIRIHGGWCYPALVVDLYSCHVMGSALSTSADANLSCRAMRNALETRRHNGCLIFHSDQDCEYKSK
ncbi:TPA: DDE-type integrase/transposase/recombinase [Klebsiella variicola]|nr:DDE-type integrase/transposase/recombinase [Klebsiella variicola]HCB0487599.1 DDE-type integrase/transposase/recombinase [Klebsiella pneumoniae]